MSPDEASRSDTEKADTASIYGALEQIERAVAELYGWLAEKFADNSEAAHSSTK